MRINAAGKLKGKQNGVDHIMPRGTNGQRIFEDDADYRRHLEMLAKQRKESGYSLYGY